MNRILLDVTRTISRAGLGPQTGIDRVERAWIGWALSQRWDDARFLAKIGGGAVTVGAEAMRRALDEIDGAAAPPSHDLRGAVSLKKRPLARRVESGLRRNAGETAAGALYANVGHANLSVGALAAARSHGAAATLVKLHDLIPLEYPEFARPDGPAKMRRRLDAAGAADAVVYNSADTRDRAERRLPEPPPSVVAPLGVDIPLVTATAHDGFVILGTIEPRKNHALLLDLWDKWADAPPLHVIGRRGWMNEAVFARLDRRPANVAEHGDLDDDAALRLLAGARGLLFPSFAEGFGLPLAEALALGVPVIASDLPALREVGGGTPIWLDPSDPTAWRRAIDDLRDAEGPVGAARRDAAANWAPPRWADHFEAVDQLLDGIGFPGGPSPATPMA